MIAQESGFTGHFLKERNNRAYFRLKKMSCGSREQARARQSREKCGLVGRRSTRLHNLQACQIQASSTNLPGISDSLCIFIYYHFRLLTDRNSNCQNKLYLSTKPAIKQNLKCQHFKDLKITPASYSLTPATMQVACCNICMPSSADTPIYPKHRYSNWHPHWICP